MKSFQALNISTENIQGIGILLPLSCQMSNTILNTALVVCHLLTSQDLFARFCYFGRGLPVIFFPRLFSSVAFFLLECLVITSDQRNDIFDEKDHNKLLHIELLAYHTGLSRVLSKETTAGFCGGRSAIRGTNTVEVFILTAFR